VSTWENFDSSSSDSYEKANLGFITDVVDNLMLEDSYNEVDFTILIVFVYQEAIYNIGITAFGYKTMKRNYNNACKKNEWMQKGKVNLNDLSLKTTKLIQEKENLCKENMKLKFQNTNLKNLKTNSLS